MYHTPSLERNYKSGIATWAIVVGIMALIIGGLAIYNYTGNKAEVVKNTDSQEDTAIEDKKTDQDDSKVEPTAQATTESAEEEDSVEYAYVDGEYEQTGVYTSPGGAEELGVKLTLKDDVIENVEVEVKATLPVSKKLQEDFAANYKDQVVGKKIDEVKLDKISGASLTPKGFNDAIEKIKEQAQIS